MVTKGLQVQITQRISKGNCLSRLALLEAWGILHWFKAQYTMPLETQPVSVTSISASQAQVVAISTLTPSYSTAQWGQTIELVMNAWVLAILFSCLNSKNKTLSRLISMRPRAITFSRNQTFMALFQMANSKVQQGPCSVFKLKVRHLQKADFTAIKVNQGHLFTRQTTNAKSLQIQTTIISLAHQATWSSKVVVRSNQEVSSTMVANRSSTI